MTAPQQLRRLLINVIVLLLLTPILIPNTLVLCKVDIEFDPYKEIGVPKHATTKEIKKAYKKLALRYHPDRTKDESSTAKMSRINEAFAVIGDEKKRKEYDRQSQSSGGFHNIFRHSQRQRKDEGLGILLNHENSYNLLRKLDDNKPWLMLAYADWNRNNNQQAKALFEEACSKLGGIAHCGKFNADRQRGLQNEFSIRRVPSFVVYYNDFENDKQYSKTINWNKNDVKAGTLVNGLNEVLPNTCKMIYDIKDSNTFFNSQSFFANADSDPNALNGVKTLIFSDAQTRKKPHILLQYLANKFSKTMSFGYHYMDNNHRKQEQSRKIAESIGLELDDLEPPEMYVFRSPIILTDIIKLMKQNDDKNSGKKKTNKGKDIKIKQDFTLEDMGIYRISLESAVDSMTQFVLQYSTPLIPKIDGDNFIDFCYLGTDGRLDDSKLCFIFGVMDERVEYLKELLIFGQYLLANIDDTIPQFGWVNCNQQQKFCESTKLVPKSKDSFKLTSLWMSNDKYINYQTEFGFKTSRNREKIYENDEMIDKTSQWVSKLENNVENSGDKRLNWKNNPNISFPTKTTNWKDDMNTWIISPILKLLGFGVSAVGSGASAIGTMISYFLQFGLLFVFMFVLLPMLRAIG